MVEYIFKDMSILASVGLVDIDRKQYGVYVTSCYSFNRVDISQDYVRFSDVIAIFKKVSCNEEVKNKKVCDYFPINPTNPLTDLRNLC